MIGLHRHVICAPDKFRGALTSAEAASVIAAGARRAGAIPLMVPLADGGEGTIEAILRGGGAEPVVLSAYDAAGRTCEAVVAKLRDGAVLIEAASVLAASAREELPRDPLTLSSRGLGELLRSCLDDTPQRIDVALGGVSTIDGGLGLLASLGVEVAEKAPLMSLGRFDIDLRPALQVVGETRLRVLYDVDCPLFGTDGAAYMFGAQKGLSSSQIAAVDAALRHLAATVGPEHAARPGAGAAGGLGFALYALGARGVSGAASVSRYVDLDGRLERAALCITGEGRLDRSSARGKVVSEVLRAARQRRVRAAVIAGVADEPGREFAAVAGACDVTCLGPAGRPLARALDAAADELEEAAYRQCAKHLSANS